MKKIVLFIILLTSLTFGQSDLLLIFSDDADITAPLAPTSLAAVGGVGTMGLTWTDPVAVDLEKIYIYRGTSTNPTTLLDSVNAGVELKDYTSQTQGTIYFYRVKARDTLYNYSDYSSNASDTVNIAIPTSILAVGNVAKITLSWTNAATYDSVKIYRGTSTNPTTLVYTLAGNLTSKIDTPLTIGTIYFYRVKGKIGNSLSSYSSNASDTAGNYSGAELITNAIDRGMELGSLLYASNFSAGVDGWAAVGTEVTLAGNIDGIYGQDNVLRANVSAAFIANHRFLKGLNQNASNYYSISFKYFIPTGNDSVTQITPLSNGFASPVNVATTKSAWTTYTRGYIEDASTSTNNSIITINKVGGLATSDVADSVYIKDISIHQAPSYYRAGNHLTDTSTTYKQAGSYSLKLTSSAAGNGTTNTVTFGSGKFTAVTNGSYYRLQLYAYTSTASTVLTFKLGDITKTATVSTVGMSVINLDFQATASTTGNILLYLDKAATVYLDDISLKGAQ